jgi:hypothetical protein
MKIVLIIFSVIFLFFLASQCFLYKSSHDIEGYKYVIIKSFTDFEIRAYEASLFTSVKLETDDYSDASSQGFSILGGYIFGKNENKEKISMTSPVSMTLEEDMTMMFLVPNNLKKEDLPKPDNSHIKFIEIPDKKMAAITFSGWANNNKIQSYKLALMKLLDENGIKHSNKFLVLGYNPPFELFFRKNEIIVELD